jgi:hypothetical protein
VRKTASIVLAAALALAGAGAALASLSPSQYRAQATTICKGTSTGFNKAIPGGFQGLRGPWFVTAGFERDIEGLLKLMLPVFHGQYDKLKKLDPPKVYRFLHAKVLSLEKQQLDGVQVVLDQIRGGTAPQKAFDAANAKLKPLADAELTAWSKLGVPACRTVQQQH